MEKMQKVIVAGATGYLGRFVVQESKKEAFGFVHWREMHPALKLLVSILLSSSSETAEAFQYFGEGHFKGKIVIAVENNNKT
jgi:NADPH:quinone reductase-like Zn-dependent oxidoreductase